MIEFPGSQCDTTSTPIRGSSEQFDFEISQRPDFSLITLALREGGQVFAEPAAMACMSPTIRLKAGFKGGLRKTLGRALGDVRAALTSAAFGRLLAALTGDAAPRRA